MNNKTPLDIAQEMVDSVMATQKELAKELLAQGKHPDDWVMVDNLDDVLSGVADKYVCRAQFLLKQDR